MLLLAPPLPSMAYGSLRDTVAPLKYWVLWVLWASRRWLMLGENELCDRLGVSRRRVEPLLWIQVFSQSRIRGSLAGSNPIEG